MMGKIGHQVDRSDQCRGPTVKKKKKRPVRNPPTPGTSTPASLSRPRRKAAMNARPPMVGKMGQIVPHPGSV